MKNVEDIALTARKSLKDVFGVNITYPVSFTLLEKIVSPFGIMLKKEYGSQFSYYLRKSKHGKAIIHYTDEMCDDFAYIIITLFGCVLFDFKSMHTGDIRVYDKDGDISDDIFLFSRAFLMPASEFRYDARFKFNDLKALSDKYGISQKIVEKRCLDLGVVL